MGVAADPTVFSQQDPAQVWLVRHGYPYRPEVDVFDNDGTPVYVDVSFPEPALVRVEWAFPTTGTVRLS